MPSMTNTITASHLDAIYDTLPKRLTAFRVRHTLGVAHAALRLARRWEADATMALAVGMLHDIAKEEKPSALRQRIEQAPDWKESADESYPAIWHAVAGAIVAEKEFGLPREMAWAIRVHPTGDAEMSQMDKILFLADSIEPGRSWDGVDALRLLAMENLDDAVRQAIFRKTDHVRDRSKPLHPRSQRARAMAERGAMV